MSGRIFSIPLLISLLAIIAGSRLAMGAEVATPEQERFFEEKVRPLLVQACFECHGEKKQESDLRLDTATSFAKGGASGESLIASPDHAQSYLLKVVRHEGDVKMPPKSKLNFEQIAALSTWVNWGAPWPKSASVEPVQLSATQRVEAHRKDHWAFQKVVAPAVPQIKDTAWPRQDLDRFILVKLSEKGLTPSPEADKHTLIRRLTYDLTGLPPTPEEAAAFLADESPEAYEKLVDRLLASPHYGEHWGRHWLDVARYADTRGYNFEGDRRFPYSYTYRDYVIAAFNADMPYRQFILEQLAADQLDLGDDRAALAGLGFITVGRKFLNHHDILDDQIDVISRGLLGLTVACARCHDHKYDAIPSEDYYSLYGVLASSAEPPGADLPVIGQPQNIAEFEVFEKKMKELEGQLNEFIHQTRTKVEEHARTHVASYWAHVAVNSDAASLAPLKFVTVPPDDLRKQIVNRWRDYLRDRARPDHPTLGLWAELSALPAEKYATEAPKVVERWRNRPTGMASGQVNPELLAALKDYQPQHRGDAAEIYGRVLKKGWEAWKNLGGNDGAFDKLTDELRPFSQMIAAQDSPATLSNDAVLGLLRRDEANKHRDLKKNIDAHQASSPGAPPRAMILREREHPHNPVVFLRGNPDRRGKQVPRQMLAVVAGQERQPFTHRGGRLDLAEAIASPENPLTRRVFVNRVWMHHFGEPLVETPSDFGIRTPQPEQLALLDHLATWFLDHGWSVKQLHRYLVTSATYRQASHDRPECKAIDPENRLYWKMNRQRLEWEALRDSLLFASGRLDQTMGGKPVEIAAPPYSNRRTIYGYIDRQDLPNLFRVFDLASPDASVARRSRTMVPQQALYLMNSAFAQEQAAALAKRSDDPEHNGDAERIARLFRFALGRAPTDHERELAAQFLGDARSGGSAGDVDPWTRLAQALLMSNEFASVD